MFSLWNRFLRPSYTHAPIFPKRRSVSQTQDFPNCTSNICFNLHNILTFFTFPGRRRLVPVRSEGDSPHNSPAAQAADPLSISEPKMSPQKVRFEGSSQPIRIRTPPRKATQAFLDPLPPTESARQLNASSSSDMEHSKVSHVRDAVEAIKVDSATPRSSENTPRSSRGKPPRISPAHHSPATLVRYAVRTHVHSAGFPQCLEVFIQFSCEFM